MKKCRNVTASGRCPNPAAVGRKMCAVCMGVVFDDDDLNKQIIAMEARPVTHGPAFGGSPDRARDSARRCMAVRDDESGNCGKPAQKNSPWCDMHEKSRYNEDFEPSREIDETLCTAWVSDTDRCQEKSSAKGFCENHYEEYLKNTDATPGMIKALEISDTEGQIKTLLDAYATMHSICKYGETDRDRVNAARALEKISGQVARRRQDWVKEKRAMDDGVPQIYGFGDDPIEKLPEFIDDSFEDFKKSLPKGDRF